MSQTSQRPKKVGDLVSDKIDLSRHVEIDLATSFRQIKKSRPGRRQVGDKFWTKKVGDLVADKSVTSFRQKKSGTWSQTSFRQIKKSRTWSRTWSATCLRPGLRQVGDLVSDKSETWSPTR